MASASYRCWVGLFGFRAKSSPRQARRCAPRWSPPRPAANCCPLGRSDVESTMPIARGSLLCFRVGIVPGSAHIIASFLSYAVEKRVSKTPGGVRARERWRALGGPEAANNATSAGAFVPMLALASASGPVGPAVLIGRLPDSSRGRRDLCSSTRGGGVPSLRCMSAT